MYPGFADTELARSNTAIKYREEFGNFRVAGLAQIGGYITRATAHRKCGRVRSAGTSTNLYGGTLSLDVVGGYAVDGVLTSPFHHADPEILFDGATP